MLLQVVGWSNCLPSGERKIPKILGKRGKIILKSVHTHTNNQLLSAQFCLGFLFLLTSRWFLPLSIFLCLTPLFLLQHVIGTQYNCGPTALTFTLMIHKAHTHSHNPYDHSGPAMWLHIFVFHSSKSFSHTHVCGHTHASHFPFWLIFFLMHTNIYSTCTTSSSCC